MFSEVLLPLTNLDYLREIKTGRIGLSLFLISLDLILLVKMLKLMPILSHLVWIVHLREKHNARMREVFRNHLSTEKGLYNPH